MKIMHISTRRITTLSLLIVSLSLTATFSLVGDEKDSAQPKGKKAAAAAPAKKADADAPPAKSKKATAAAPAKSPTKEEVAKSTPDAKLADQVRAAKKSFTAVDPKRLAVTRRTAVDAAENLANRFKSMSQPNGADWAKYVRLEALQTDLQKPNGVDVALLNDVHDRLTAGYDGLEKEPYRDLAAALAAYAPAIDAAQNKDLQKEYERRLDDLAETISAVGEAGPDAAQAATIGDAVVWLKQYGQAPQLVADLTRRYSQPNLLVDVDESFVAGAIGGKVDEEEPVRDLILGTTIRGQGRTVGELNLDFVPSPNQAVIDAYFRGTNYSKTVGYNRSALIYSTGRTELEGQKTLHVSESGIQAVSGVTHAEVHNKIDCIGSSKSGIVGKIVIKVASKKAPEQQAEAQCIAARHAEQRLLRKLNDQSAEFVEQANADYQRRLRLPLLRFDAVPRVINIATTDDALRVRVLQDGGERLAAPAAAPQPAKTGAGIRLHHSLVDNTTQKMLAGRRFDRERLIDLIQNQLGLEPPVNDDDTPFAITFADRDPLTLSLDDGVIGVTVRGKQFMSDDKLYEGMNITARYKAETSGDGIKLTREGDLSIYPPGFRSGVDKLSVSQTALRRLLQRRFEKMLPGEVVGEGVELEGDLGRLVVSQLQIENGWAVLGWTRKPAATEAE